MEHKLSEGVSILRFAPYFKEFADLSRIARACSFRPGMVSHQRVAV